MHSERGALADTWSHLSPPSEDGSQSPVLSPIGPKSCPAAPSLLLLAATIHHPSQKGPGCEGGDGWDEEVRGLPKARGQVSALRWASLSCTPNPDTKHIPTLRLKDPWGSPICQRLRQWGHGKRKCLAQLHQIPLPAEHSALVPHLAVGVTQQPIWPQVEFSHIPKWEFRATTGLHLAHRYAGTHGHSLAGTMPGSSFPPGNPVA